jgi:hypothetical protein
MASGSIQGPRYVRVAFVNELRGAIARWAFGRDLRGRAQTWRQQIAREKASCLEHLNALRNLVNSQLPPRERRAALTALDRLEMSLSTSGRWELLQRFKLPPHRPIEKHTRDALRAAMKRHHVDATTTATVIIHRIAPMLPADARAALRGPSREQSEQIRYLADKWLRRTR